VDFRLIETCFTFWDTTAAAQDDSATTATAEEAREATDWYYQGEGGETFGGFSLTQMVAW